jgi:hypothetical protein
MNTTDQPQTEEGQAEIGQEGPFWEAETGEGVTFLGRYARRGRYQYDLYWKADALDHRCFIGVKSSETFCRWLDHRGIHATPEEVTAIRRAKAKGLIPLTELEQARADIGRLRGAIEKAVKVMQEVDAERDEGLHTRIQSIQWDFEELLAETGEKGGE